MQKSGNAIFNCINDSNVRFIKDIMLILYRKVWKEDLDLLVIFILVVKVKHVALKVKSSVFSARTRRSHSCNEYLEKSWFLGKALLLSGHICADSYITAFIIIYLKPVSKGHRRRHSSDNIVRTIDNEIGKILERY